MSSTRSPAAQVSTSAEVKPSGGRTEGTVDHLNEAPRNISQRIVVAGLEYEATGNLNAFLGELIVCICDLDLATMKRDGRPG